MLKTFILNASFHEKKLSTSRVGLDVGRNMCIKFQLFLCGFFFVMLLMLFYVRSFVEYK